MESIQEMQARINKANLARSSAIQLKQLIDEEVDRLDDSHAVDVFWKEITRIIPAERLEQVTKVIRDVPMTNEEAKRFGNTALEFGKHAGKQIKDIPYSYLAWLDEQVDFRRKLNRYLRSKHVQCDLEIYGDPEED